MPEGENEIRPALRESMLDMIRAIGPILESGRSLLTEKRYPEIDDFKVIVYPNEGKHRGRPHCQVRIAEKTATFDIETGDLMVGNIDPWERTVRKVLLQNQDGILKFWHEMRPDDQKLPSK